MRYSNPELLEQAINEFDLGIIIIDAQFKVVLWNGWMVTHSGRAKQDVAGSKLLDICPELENSRVFEAITNTLETGQPAIISNVLNRTPFALYPPLSLSQLRPEQARIQQAIKIVPISIASQANYCLVQINDVTASVKRERALEQQVKDRKLIEQKLSQERSLFIAGPTVVLTWRTKPKWQIDYISPNITLQFGYRTEQFTDSTLHFPDLIHADDVDVFLESLEGDKTKNQAHVEQEFRILDASGQYRWVYNLTSINRNMQGEVSDYLGYMLDISQRKLFQEKIEHQAYFDELTGLPNRRMFLDRLQREIVRARRREYMGALFFIDLDRFKMINDTLGHEVGDQLLQKVAKRLQCCLRADDTAARLGGDEFVVILSDLGAHRVGITHTCLMVAEKVRNALGEKYIINGNEVISTPSIGIVTFPAKNQATAEDLIRYADTAMYQAKNDGRNEIRFFSHEMQEQVDQQQQLEKSLRNAIELNQFTLNFQPSFNIHNEIVNTEVLLRWHHPERGWISPAEFIPLAEETGFILPLGEWVLRETCRQLKAWETANPDSAGFYLPLISVNVSPKQFRQHEFVTQVSNILDEFDIEPGRLEIELTEGIVIADLEDTINKMNALKNLGILIAIDDFGTGYSSLAYLKRLPIDVLKIDQSFVRNIAEDKDNSVIVETILSMTRHLGLNTIAEGVETIEELNFLIAQGCDTFQGYYFSKPINADDFCTLYHKLLAEDLKVSEHN